MADHQLVVITSYDHGRDGCTYTVRWCERCGAIVHDAEVDGRIYPGRAMKMRRPAATRSNGPCDTAIAGAAGE